MEEQSIVLHSEVNGRARDGEQMSSANENRLPRCDVWRCGRCESNVSRLESRADMLQTGPDGPVGLTRAGEPA
jgi:hypothetical protein